MCLSVEHYFGFYLNLFLYEFEDVPRKNSFRRHIPGVKTIIDVPGKVVYYTTVYCRARCLSFLLKLSRMTTLLGKS